MHLQRPVPLTTSLVRILRQRLRADYAAGGRLPSEPDMASEFGVSRGTVRQALAILEREGAVIRRQGSGTYVNLHALQIQARAESAYEFTDLLGRAGFEASIRTLTIARQPIPVDMTGALDVEPGSEGIVVHKLFLADDQPAIDCLDVIPLGLVCEPYDDQELHAPIFDFLLQRCHQTITYCLASLIPAAAADALGDLLDLTPGTPLLRFDEVSYNESNQPVLFARVHYRDQFVRFSVLRKKV